MTEPSPWLEDEAVRTAQIAVAKVVRDFHEGPEAGWGIYADLLRASLDTLVETAWRAGALAAAAFMEQRAELAADMSQMDGSRASNARWALRAATLLDASMSVRRLLPPSPERSETP